MSIYETVIRHIDQGNTYSWDLTALLGLGVAVSAPLREKLLLGKTTADTRSEKSAPGTRVRMSL